MGVCVHPGSLEVDLAYIQLTHDVRGEQTASRPTSMTLRLSRLSSPPSRRSRPSTRSHPKPSLIQRSLCYPSIRLHSRLGLWASPPRRRRPSLRRTSAYTTRRSMRPPRRVSRSAEPGSIGRVDVDAVSMERFLCLAFRMGATIFVGPMRGEYSCACRLCATAFRQACPAPLMSSVVTHSYCSASPSPLKSTLSTI